MKKLLLLAAAAALTAVCGLLPFEGREVGGLLPVRALVVGRENGELTVSGGDGLTGRGPTWQAAMDNLKATVAGDVFYGSTCDVIFRVNAADAVADAMRDNRLRPAVRVYLTAGRPDAEDAADFLRAHPGGVTLQDIQAAALERKKTELPVLACGSGGRFALYDR